MSKRKRDGEVDEVHTIEVRPVSGRNYVILQGFSDADVAVVKSQLSRFGLNVISNGDPAVYSGARVVASSNDLALLYAEYHKSFVTVPEPVPAEPVISMVSGDLEDTGYASDTGAWGSEQRN